MCHVQHIDFLGGCYVKFRAVLLVGAPGAGKGTQGKALGQLPGFYHCACGDVFRTLDESSELGRVFTEHSARGELVPDDLTVKLWLQRLGQLEHSGDWRPKQDILVLDGIPRNVSQACILDEYADILRVVELHCADRELLVRRIRSRALKSNRYDDASERVIRHRLDVYDEEAQSLLEYYPNTAHMRVNAEQPPVLVLSDVIEAIRKFVI